MNIKELQINQNGDLVAIAEGVKITIPKTKVIKVIEQNYGDIQIDNLKVTKINICNEKISKKDIISKIVHILIKAFKQTRYNGMSYFPEPVNMEEILYYIVKYIDDYNNNEIDREQLRENLSNIFIEVYIERERDIVSILLRNLNWYREAERDFDNFISSEFDFSIDEEDRIYIESILQVLAIE